MGLYSKLVLPYLTDFAMRDKVAAPRRSELVQGADGIVLEIGIGSGLNLKDLSTLRDQLEPGAQMPHGKRQGSLFPDRCAKPELTIRESGLLRGSSRIFCLDVRRWLDLSCSRLTTDA